MKNGLRIKVDNSHGKYTRFILEGRISLVEASELQFELEEAFRKNQFNVVLNMRKVTFLSSAGIRVILMYFKKLKEYKGKLWVQSPSECVENVLGMVALDEMLLRGS